MSVLINAANPHQPSSLIGSVASSRIVFVGLLLIIATRGPTAIAQPAAVSAPSAAIDEAVPTPESDVSKGWNLLPTDDTELWSASVFGGDGNVEFTKEAIRMSSGDPITGVRCRAEIPKQDFEIELEARRTKGFDFFCGLTFPVGDDGQCSFVVAGWAGAVVGLSSVDGQDAARNPTKKLMSFENDTWYKVRVRVDEAVIRCWIDDELIVEQAREGHKFDIRAEMYESLPLGIAAYMSASELRNVRWRKLDDGDAGKTESDQAASPGQIVAPPGRIN
jgi:hypothetical protein